MFLSNLILRGAKLQVFNYNKNFTTPNFSITTIQFEKQVGFVVKLL